MPNHNRIVKATIGFFKTKPKRTTQYNSTTFDQNVIDAGTNILGRGMELPGLASSVAWNRGYEGLAGLGQDFDMATAAPYQDAYEQAARAGFADIDETLGNTESDIQDSTGYGMGGSRAILQRMRARDLASRQKAGMVANARAEGLGFARNVHAQNQANRMAGVQANMNAGLTETTQPMQQIMQLMGLLSAMPKNVHTTGTGVQTGGTNPGMDLLGMGLQAAGTYAGLKGA